MRNKRLIIIFSCLIAVTVLVLLSSVVFSVKNINARCLNQANIDPMLEQKIIDSTGIPKGKSIFFVKENEIIANIQKSVPGVDVINIERKFPDRLTVHYVKLLDYYEVAANGFYYSVTHDGRVTAEREAPLDDDQKIRIIFNVSGAPKVNDYICDHAKRQLLSGVVSAFERLDLKGDRPTARFDFVDIDAEMDCVYIGVSGVNNLIKIEGVSESGSLFEKIRLGYSVIISPSFDRVKGEDGRYRMVYVISATRALDPYSDYGR